MRVAIDIQTTLGQPTGFGFYVSNLVSSLRKIKSDIDLITIKPPSSDDLSTPQRFLWDQFTFPKLANKEKVDILHQPCFSAPLFYKGPIVVTVHDIINILFPDNVSLPSRIFYSKWMPLTYKKASRIITISESTKKDIVKNLGIQEEKIIVIPLAADKKFMERTSQGDIDKVKTKYNLPEKYILHIGTLEPRKNLGFLIEVFSEVVKDKKTHDWSLVITGKKGWHYQELYQKVKKLGLENKVIFTGYFDEVDKPALYKGATIFVFPSLYEGFGLPPLEAMASGVPVVSSNASSMPEVVGDAGILISPQDKILWVKSIKKVLSEGKLRDKMRVKNKKQVANFSWEKTAERTAKVYKGVAADKKI